MNHSPYSSPPLPIPTLITSPQILKNDSVSSHYELLSKLPGDFESWNYSQVTQFIVSALNLPSILKIDIKIFILNKEIDGKKLLLLDGESLSKLGFNKLWCHHLSIAIDEIRQLAKIDEAENDNTNFEIKKGSLKVKSKAKEQVERLKRFGSMSRPKFHTISTCGPAKPFSLPQVEMTLMRQFMLSETVGMKTELTALKKLLKKSLDDTELDKAPEKYHNKKPSRVSGYDGNSTDPNDNSYIIITGAVVAAVVLVAGFAIKANFSKR